MIDDENRPCTPEDFDRLMRPLFERLLAKHGKKEATRMFASAAVAAGFDPKELRVVFAEDVS